MANNPDLSKEEAKFYNMYIEMLQKSEKESRFHLDKHLTYISSGVLIGSMFFIEKILPVKESDFKIFLLLCWCLTGLGLILNLYSHMHAASTHSLVKKMFDSFEKITNESVSILNTFIDIRNNKQDSFSKWSLIFLISGITSLVTFVTINIL